MKVKTFESSNNKLGIAVQFVSYTFSTTVTLKVDRVVQASLQEVAVVVVVVSYLRLRSIDLAGQFAFSMSVNENTTSVNHVPPPVWMDSPYGGMQGRCMIGLKTMYFGGDGTLNTRSVLFLQDDSPFTNSEVIVPSG